MLGPLVPFPRALQHSTPWAPAASPHRKPQMCRRPTSALPPKCQTGPRTRHTLPGHPLGPHSTRASTFPTTHTSPGHCEYHRHGGATGGKKMRPLSPNRAVRLPCVHIISKCPTHVNFFLLLQILISQSILTFLPTSCPHPVQCT